MAAKRISVNKADQRVREATERQYTQWTTTAAQLVIGAVRRGNHTEAANLCAAYDKLFGCNWPRVL